MHPLGVKPPEPGSLHARNQLHHALTVDAPTLLHGCWLADECVTDERCPFVTECRVVDSGDQDAIDALPPSRLVARLAEERA